MHSLIISAVGSDRPGIVSELSGTITSHGGNIEKSRMTRLGSDFTIIMLVTVDPKWEESLVIALQAINELSITTKGTEPNTVAGENCQISLSGADNEGIVKVLSKYLEEKSINIIEMDTHISQAPISGSPLFNLNASVSIPGEVDGRDIQSDLSQGALVGGSLRRLPLACLPSLGFHRSGPLQEGAPLGAAVHLFNGNFVHHGRGVLLLRCPACNAAVLADYRDGSDRAVYFR